MGTSRGRKLTGRTVIYSDVEQVTADNILDVLEKAFATHEKNRSEMDYLWNYYLGDQDILDKVKEIRPEINNTIISNHAFEIVDFKVGYTMAEPVVYIASNSDADSDAINMLNTYNRLEKKHTKDKRMADWAHVVGTSYRMTLPNKAYTKNSKVSPYNLFCVDPRDAFVVYRNDLAHTPLLGVKYITTDENVRIYSCYTPTTYFEVTDQKVTDIQTHRLGEIPLKEYPLNMGRIGAFEIVLGLLNAINDLESARLDEEEQYVQSLLMLKGVDMDDEDFQKLRQQGGLLVPPDGDAKFIGQSPNQGSSQVQADNLYEKVLIICGMPNRNGSSSTSDTGSAVIMRDGWGAAEARAKDFEAEWKDSEVDTIRLMLHICEDLAPLNITEDDVEPKFTRRNYENIQSKSQVLVTMLNNDKIDPKLAFSASGMFTDPEQAYAMSEAYYLKQQEEEQKLLRESYESEVAESKSEINNDYAAQLNNSAQVG